MKGAKKMAGPVTVVLLVVVGLLATELNAKTLGIRTGAPENHEYQALLEAIANGDKDLNQVDLSKLLESQKNQPAEDDVKDDSDGEGS